MTASLEIAAKAVAGWLKEADRPLVVGICGAQGSGKSALATKLEGQFNGKGVATCVLSLDDFYLARPARPAGIHPLFATRGVPGTHDVPAMITVLDALTRGEPALVPRFDKAADAPLPESQWRREAPAGRPGPWSRAGASGRGRKATMRLNSRSTTWNATATVKACGGGMSMTR
ncbi:MAG: hypothetical protein WDN06_20500 [Asticcacaulis sp.]